MPDLYSQLAFPFFKRLDPETIHSRTLTTLSLAQMTRPGRLVLRRVAGEIPALPVQIGPLLFPNPLGMAAGFDKDARVVIGLAMLGFGHIEVGTLTPRPQMGNPRPRIFRLPSDEALINRMGFPNEGVAAALPRLRALAGRVGACVLGVSLGKQKDTPLEDAAADYVAVMRAVWPYADYLAVNISSPNTPGLRQLQGGRYLETLLATLVAENCQLALGVAAAPKPLWVKIAPDLSDEELDEVLSALIGAGIDGVIATNTTLARDGLVDPHRDEAGGLSGRPLRARSTAMIAAIHRRTAGTLPIIGVGGIASAGDVREKLAAGASVVQLYSGLVYGGPQLPGRILRELAAPDRGPALDNG